METIAQVLLHLLENPLEISEYRPPRWESPIEEHLWSVLRYIGINAETQVPIGDFRVDMIVSSRRNNNKAIVECDGAEYHHRVIDEFRDDELLNLAHLPIAHVYGKEIKRSAERCALFITEHWFPEHMDTYGYSSTLEMAYRDNPEDHVDGCSGFFPVGYVRPIAGDIYPSYSDIKARSLVRYITGDNDGHIFEDENDRKLFTSIKAEIKQRGLIKSKLSPQELARAYIIICYDEPDRSLELGKLDSFLNRLALINSNSSGIIGGYRLTSVSRGKVKKG